jgi:ATP-binding cassette subfamily B multidrug efflux pump
MQRNFDKDEVVMQPFDRAQFLRLLRYLVPHKKAMAASIGIMCIAAVTAQLGPYFFKIAIDEGIPNRDFHLINYLGVGFLGLAFVNWLCARWRTLIMSRVGQSVLYTMRKQLFDHIQSLSFRFYDSRPAGKIMVRITSDVNTLNQLLTNGIVNVVSELFNLIVIVILMLSMHTKLALLSFTILPILALFALALRPQIRRKWYRVRLKLSSINAYLNESIMGIRVTQAFTREENNQRYFEGLNQELKDSCMEAIRLNALFMPMVEIIAAVGTGLVIWYGTGLIRTGVLTVGILVAFLNYLWRFWVPINMLADFYTQIQTAMASAQRVFEILDTKPEIKDAACAIELPPIKGEVAFEHVNFGYDPGQVVLKDFSLKVRPGQTIALVGPTGAGKSSIINLLTRFYDPQAGRITIDGVDIKKVTVESLRSQIGIVLQDTFIFSGPIRENLRYGRLDATMREIIEAAQIANAHEFIINFPDGYDTEVEERGAKLSVGQRQLLSFARALLADPRILILDEATSSIDTETELLIQQALARLLVGRTSFVIAHRLSTIQNADRIVVVDHGTIVEQGTHRELLGREGIYRELCEAQLKPGLVGS